MDRVRASLWVFIAFFVFFNSFSFIAQFYLGGAIKFTGLLGHLLVERQLYYLGLWSILTLIALPSLCIYAVISKVKVKALLSQYVRLILSVLIVLPSSEFLLHEIGSALNYTLLTNRIGGLVSFYFQPVMGWWGLLLASLLLFKLGLFMFVSIFLGRFSLLHKMVGESKSKTVGNTKKRVGGEEKRNVPTVSGDTLELPSLNLLTKIKKQNNELSKGDKESMSESVESALASYQIQAKVEGIITGPVVTRFVLRLASGTKVTKVLSASNDIARMLKVQSVRVVDVIPGSSNIGIELPNLKRAIVSLQEVLSSNVFAHSKHKLPVALGMDITGNPYTIDLSKAPHLLVAGTTGSGKSVGVNTMILSLIYKLSPKDLRFIMIDPKMLELSVYEGIPHMYAPVVTDMSKATKALSWCCAEMDRRYSLLSQFGVRGIDAFNEKFKEHVIGGIKMVDSDGAEIKEKMPYIVVVIDEFADLIMVAGKKVEELVARLAQKARASGIHIVLATQRPSVDVLTGLIKANVPSRISFKVSSKIDSRTILDRAGGEQLLGNGDMLVSMTGGSGLDRVHGAFVDDGEVSRVASYLSAQSAPEYIELEVEQVEQSSGISCDEEDREIVNKAFEILEDGKSISISKIQRQLRIGYNRAARVVEHLESNGVLVADEKGNKIARLG